MTTPRIIRDVAARLAPGGKGGVMSVTGPLDVAVVADLERTAVSSGARFARLDGPNSKAALLEAIATGLDLPAWFGRNWDALEEMLARPEPPLAGPILLLWDRAERLDRVDAAAGKTFRSIIKSAAAERGGVGLGSLVALVPRPRRDEGAMERRTRRLPEVVRSTGRIHHVALVVEDLERSLRFWRDTLGLPLETVMPIPGDHVEIAFLTVGESKVELVRPTDDTTGVARFLASKGEGFHHVCLEVPNLAEALLHLGIEGIELIDSAPRKGAEGPVAFLHPRSCGGVLVELIEAPGGPAWRSLGYPPATR
jgi:methylmalonyl-CoA epimerase